MPSKPSFSSLISLFLCFFICFPLSSLIFPADAKPSNSPSLLRFGQNGRFKILQVADMHYADGKTTPCEDVLPEQFPGCSDLNTTAFVERMIRAEKPDLIVFTGDNIYGLDATDAGQSLNAAFAPAILSGIPWAAVLGNHDQESTLSREGVMQQIVQMKHTVSRLNPTANSCHGEGIDGYGNYNMEVAGVEGSSMQNKSILNLYFLDSGDYSTVPSIPGYGWIKPSQQFWFQRTSSKLQKEYMGGSKGQKQPAPGLAYFHIPLPEFQQLSTIDIQTLWVKSSPGLMNLITTQPDQMVSLKRERLSFKKVGHLLLVKPYMIAVQSNNIAVVNEALNEIYVEEDYERLWESIDMHANFDQIGLAHLQD